MWSGDLAVSSGQIAAPKDLYLGYVSGRMTTYKSGIGRNNRFVGDMQCSIEVINAVHREPRLGKLSIWSILIVWFDRESQNCKYFSFSVYCCAYLASD